MKPLTALIIVIAPALFAQPLKVVTVTAPRCNKVFDASGVITVQDFTSPIAKTGFLQSRNFQGVAPAPAQGKFIYEYRVNNVDSAAAITKLRVKFGPHISLDYNGDKQLDDVFVITKGGIGSVGLVSAVRDGAYITFTFSGSGVKRDSSYFFGLASEHARTNLVVTATAIPSPDLTLEAWAPIEFAATKP